MRKTTKGLVGLLGALSLTAGSYYGVGHGTRLFYQDQLNQALAPKLIAEQCMKAEIMPDGRIHETTTLETHKYTKPDSFIKGLNYDQP